MYDFGALWPIPELFKELQSHTTDAVILMHSDTKEYAITTSSVTVPAYTTEAPLLKQLISGCPHAGINTKKVFFFFYFIRFNAFVIFCNK